MTMRKDRTPIKSSDEHDWTSGWRRLLCVFQNNTGLGKKIKRAINKRARQKGKKDAVQD